MRATTTGCGRQFFFLLTGNRAIVECEVLIGMNRIFQQPRCQYVRRYFSGILFLDFVCDVHSGQLHCIF